MPNFAVINNGKVSNVIFADSKEIVQQTIGQICIEYTDESPAHIGLSWDEVTGFEQPSTGVL
jgi:hypothetical protein